MSRPWIDFVYIRKPLSETLLPYKVRVAYPASTTWEEVREKEGDVLRPLRREWQAYSWPGGSPLFYVTKDNGVLCPKCATENLKLTLGDDPQWKIVASDINYEDTDLYCDHCEKRIESAYGEDDDEQD